MKKLDLHEKLYSRRIHKPNSFLYWVFYSLCKLVYKKKYGMRWTIQDDPRKENGPVIVIANHASRNDFLFAAMPLYPMKFNFLAAYNEFFRINLAFLFRVMQLIPKRQFYADSYSTFEIIRLVKQLKANVVFYPEGLSSIHGANQPSALGTGKLLKFLKVPVYSVVTSGAYLIQPKYKFWKKERYAYTETIIKKVFDPEDLKKLSIEEIEEKVDETIYNDDYEWAKNNHVIYKENGEGIAEDLETLLYKCPKCGEEFKMETKGNIIRCSHCGNEAYINNDYTIHPKDDTCKIPTTQKKRFDYQRIKIREEIENNPDFEFSVECELGIMPKDHFLSSRKTAEIVGKGTLTLSHKDGFSYKGTMNNKPYEIHISNHDLYTFVMCYNANIIHFFYGGELRQFTFKTKGMPSKIMLIQNELHRIDGGPWKMLKGFKYDENECFK